VLPGLSTSLVLRDHLRAHFEVDPMADERRRSPRVVVDVPARITGDGVTVEGQIRDICRDAALILAERAWPLGTTLSV